MATRWEDFEVVGQPAAQGKADGGGAQWSDFTPVEGESRPAGSRGVGAMVSDLGLSAWEGLKGTTRSARAAANTYGGDLPAVEGLARDQQEAARQGPAAKREFLSDIERRKAADPDPSLLSVAGNIGASALANKEGVAQFVVEQAPNTAVSLGAGVAGAKAGALAGTAVAPFLGPFAPAGPVVGGGLGFLGGMFLGNTLLETGGKAMEKAGDGFTEVERGDAMREGAVKGAVITGVDAATLGIGGAAAKMANRAAIRAGAQAEAKVLSTAGVNVADRAAVETALAGNAALLETAKKAGVDAAKLATSAGARAATAGTGLTLETFGEGVGEYVGELAATGKADLYDAGLEALAGMTQSAPETAWNMLQSSGNKLNSRGIVSAAKALPPEASAAAGAGQPAAPAPQEPGPGPQNTGRAATQGAQPSDLSAKQTDAERALLTPRSATALDRVTEIDAELPRLTARAAELNDATAGYGPTFDAERQEVGQRATELAAERDRLTAGWPTIVGGARTEFSTESGVKLGASYALVEADQLLTSHDEDLRANPLYPPELQPRERDRAASEMQIGGIVGKLDPARLGLSADAATGAPVIGADGLVESGNARTIALKRVYQANGQKAEDYRSYLRANAAQFGLDPQVIDAAKKPVLVRVRATPVDRAEFARQANASTVAQMSPSEQARADAARIDAMDDLEPDDNGDFSGPASRDFVRRFMARLPMTEQAGMVDAGGQLSTTGYARVRNAVLAKAYGDSPVLIRLTESLDDSLRNVGRALIAAAPRVATMRDAIGKGQRFDADITPPLLESVEELAKLKADGRSVADALAQTDAFSQRSPESRALLQYLDENIRRPRRMTDFLTEYMGRLDAAGSPNQATMFGAPQAPARIDLIRAARAAVEGTQDGQPIATGQDAGAARADRQQPAGQGRSDAGPAGAAPAGPAAAADAGIRASRAQPAGSEWVGFPDDLGSLGIPRAEMPQIKGEHRGALIQFLDGRGITHDTVDELPPDSLRPTQIEFSREKAAAWIEPRDDSDRSVLVSSDGYVLDGHHQWMGALAGGRPVKAIRFDAPIRELLAAAYQFPSAKRSDGATAAEPAARLKNRQALRDALNDLALIASRQARGYIVPEKTPDLMPTLIRLSEAAIREVGYQVKDIMRYVRDAIRADERFRAVWNRIQPITYRQAAEQAAQNAATAKVDDLFANSERAAPRGDLLTNPTPAAVQQREAQQQRSDREKARRDAAPPAGDFTLTGSDRPADRAEARGQRGLFDAEQPEAKPAPRVAMIDGRPYDAKRDNFKPPATDTFIPADVLAKAREQIDLLRASADPQRVSESDRLRARSVLDPIIKRAEELKPVYDQKIIDISKRTGALGQILANVKSIDSATRKLVNEVGFDADRMYDTLRSTIVVSSYGDAQAVLDSIRGQFDVLPGRVKNMADTEIDGKRGSFVPSGYGQVLVNVKLAGGVIAEIQINVPEMVAAKAAEGHALYEIERSEKNGTQAKRDAVESQRAIYPLAAAAAVARNDASLEAFEPKDVGSLDIGVKTNSAVRSSSRNTRPSGNSTNSVASPLVPNEQPSGNLAGTGIDIGSTSDTGILPNRGGLRDNSGAEQATGEAQNATDARDGETGPAGQGAGAVSGAGGQGRVAAVREGQGGRDRQPDRVADDGDRRAGRQRASQQAVDGAGGNTEAGAEPGDRGSAGRDAGVPAGRRGGQPVAPDIPPKTGQNYSFGPGDLTYEGSWRQKAEANVEAVELLKKLQAEGRQASPDEQRALARFIGWGASELANNLFGKKLDEVARMMAFYDRAVAGMKRLGRDYLRKALHRGAYADEGYYDAANLLREKQEVKSGAYWPYPEQITRAELDAARPQAGERKWLELRTRLKTALSEEEFATAARLTQYAHYTSKEVVRSMWRAVERMGFAGGQVLEPGAGIGIFPGLMPAAMAQNSVYTGIEFDPITGGILKQLFPDERIRVESFVDSKLPANFYDVAVGNPPFAGIKILSDPEYAKRAFTLHDYFFAKSLDRVKPGGLLVYVTSRYTMDKLDDKARAYMAERADLVGAIRLPQTAFMKNAGTEVVTDVLFLRKRREGEKLDGAQTWAKSVPIKVGGSEYPINEYFVAHPEMVLGQHADTGSMYKDRDYTVTPAEGDIGALFDAAVDRLPAGIYRPERGSAGEAAKVRELDFNPKAGKEGGYYVTDAGIIMQREGGVGVRVHENLSKQAVELIRDYVPLRDALKQAHYDQLNDGDWETSLAALQRAYKAFTGKHGQVKQFTTRVVKSKAVDEDTGETYTDERTTKVFPLLDKFRADPDWTLVAALESLDEDSGKITAGEFLSKRVLGRRPERQIATASDALLSVLNDTGKVDIDLIADRIGMSAAEAAESLGTAIYRDPESGWQTADEYLSGNVKSKLAVAREAAAADRRYERNIAALEAAQPRPRTPSEINAALGMTWIPGEVYSQFLRELAGVRAQVQWTEAAGKWAVTAISGERGMLAVADWGTLDVPAADILRHALSGAPIKVYMDLMDGEKKTRVINPAGTEAANAKLVAMRERFATWLWEGGERADKLTALYNDKFNTTVARTFDGRHLTLPGSSLAMNVFDHVKRGAWRVIQRGNTYLAHAVGSGKTFQMVISAMEQKRLGLINKPMVVVPNHMLAQFSSEWLQLYPAARLMVADEKNFHTDNRRRFVSQVALSDLDGVIITHSAFKLLDVDPKFRADLIDEILTAKRAALEDAQAEDKAQGKRGSLRVKQLEKQVERLEQKLEAAMSSAGKDKNARFDELGVDFLYVDEAHEFRKLDFNTDRQVKGIDPTGSDRALDLYIKKRWLESKKPGRALVLASGTPVTNTMAEIYNVQRYMDEKTLRERGLENFDAWASMFGRESTALEPNAGGQYEPVTRFNKFVNVPELTQMFREFADVLTADDLAALLGDKRPKVEGGSRKIVITPKLPAVAAYQKALAERTRLSREWRPTKDEPYNPDPVIRIIGDGRLASIDMRFIDPALPSDPDSKLNKLIDGVIETWRATKDLEYRGKDGKTEPNRGASMMVFSDIGFGAGVAAKRGFNARAWMEKRLRDAGIPARDIAFMADHKKSDAKQKLFRDVNAGRVRILVGSSKNMGTGVNAQQRLAAMFHLDSPWFPADLEQREGRIIRQGNKNPVVGIFAYATKGTYDQNMWSMIARKQKFIDQALSGDESVREIEDLDSQSQYELVAAMTADDPRVLELAGNKAEVARLQRMQQAHEQQRMEFRRGYDSSAAYVAYNEKKLDEAEKAAGTARDLSGDKFTAKAGKSTYTDRADWAGALLGAWKDLSSQVKEGKQKVGEISGFSVEFDGEKVAGSYVARLVLDTPVGAVLHATYSGESSPLGLAMRAQNAVADVARSPQKLRDSIAQDKARMDALSTRLDTPFPMAEMLAEKMAEVRRIEAELAADGRRKEAEERAQRAQAKAAGDVDVKASRAESSAATAQSLADATDSLHRRYGAKRIERLLTAGERGERGGVVLAGTQAEAMQRLEQARGKPLGERTLQSLGDDLNGFYDPATGLSFIIAEHAGTDAGAVLTHELGVHLWADTVPAEKKAALIDRAEDLVLNGKDEIAGAARERLREAGVLTDDGVLTDREEAWAYLAEEADRATAAGKTLPEKIKQWVLDMLAAIRAGLHGKGLMQIKLTPRDLAAIARANVRAAALATETAPAGRLADDLARQERWLTAEARARGFRDIDDLLTRAPKVFENLAAVWRRRNPASVLRSAVGVDAYSRAVQAWKAALERAAAVVAGGSPAPAGTAVDMPMPTVLRALGVKSNTLALPVRYLQGIVAKHGDLPASVLSSLPELLSDPAVAFPHKDGGYRVVLDARTAKGEPVVAGIGSEGRIQTITPLNDGEGMSGSQRLAQMVNGALATEGAKVYARNKEALAFTRASRGIGTDGALATPAVSSVRAGPAPIALLRDSRDKAIVILRDRVVKRAGEFGPGIKLSRAAQATLTAGDVLTMRGPLPPAGGAKRAAAAAPAPRGQASAPAPQPPERPKTPAERAEKIIQTAVTRARPVDWLARMATKYSGVEWIAGKVYDTAGYLLDRLTPEVVKAGVVSDYGVPEAVIDQRVLMQGRQRVQLRRAGNLLDKLATLTRAESRALYEWMNNEGDTAAGDELVAALPEESRQALADVQRMIDALSQEAVAMGQLSADAYRSHRYAYLRRSYEKHVLADAEKRAGRARTIALLGDQYRGRGLVQPATMSQIKAEAPEWWGRKLAGGRADTQLKGERFVRLKLRGVPTDTVNVWRTKKGKIKAGRRHVEMRPADTTPGFDALGKGESKTAVLEVAYWPAGEPIPTKYEGWDRADTWEVRDVRGDKLVLWRDFTKGERERMGEIDDARFAVAKTLQGMIHDVETGRYLEWVARTQAKVEGDAAVGRVVEASESRRAAFAPGTWVKVPDSKVAGTAVAKYGALAGKYLPGPVWNDVRQTVGGEFRPLGDTYATILRWWKTAKTALSPTVHTNNVMSNVVMADWHDVGAAHIGKALRILLAASEPQRASLLGAAGRGLSAIGGLADAAAAREVVNRYKDSGGELGSWAARELEREQMEPLLAALEREIAARGESVAAQVTAGAAVQALLARKLGAVGKAIGAVGGAGASWVGNEGRAMIDLYQSEDDVFRLAAWLKAKEDGATDVQAGKTARQSFLDYNINAPWVQAARATVLPFVGFTYRAVPMLAETAGRKPHKLIKLMAMAGLLNALGVALGGGDDEDEEIRKLLPEEKAGRLWGMVPKLIRMPWLDDNGSPVYLDIRRWIPVGDVFDIGQTQSAIPVLPMAIPGGPLAIITELMLNKSQFTGRPITMETDTAAEKAGKVADHLWKAATPNVVGVPGTWATQGVMDAINGRTDAFGREQSVPMAAASAFGVKLGAYPADVLRRNQAAKQNAQINELERERAALRRRLQTRSIDQGEYDEQLRRIGEKMREVRAE
jgi:N12 class adenine-specific DNA methylase